MTFSIRFSTKLVALGCAFSLEVLVCAQSGHPQGHHSHHRRPCPAQLDPYSGIRHHFHPSMHMHVWGGPGFHWRYGVDRFSFPPGYFMGGFSYPNHGGFSPFPYDPVYSPQGNQPFGFIGSPPPYGGVPGYAYPPAIGGNPYPITRVNPADLSQSRVPDWPNGRFQPSDTANAGPTIRELTPESQFRPSTPEELEASQAWVEKADSFRMEGRYPEAVDAYRQSILIAADRPEPRSKLAILLAETRQYRESLNELRSALALDPTQLEKAPSLGDFYGPNRERIVQNMLQSTAQWARADIRDPERLLLIGSLLLLNGDPAQAEVPLRSAERLAPGDPQIQSVLSSLHSRPPSAGIARTGYETSRAKPSPNRLPRPAPLPRQIDPAQFDPAAGEDAIQPIPKRKPDSQQKQDDPAEPDTSGDPTPRTLPDPTPPNRTSPGEDSDKTSDAPEAAGGELDGPTFPGALN